MTEESGQRLPEAFRRIVPEGEDRARLVCATCGFINYENPKIVVGSVVHDGGKVLLCRRAINPRKGFWTLPAGYLELNETAYLLGYEDANSFFRAFQQWEGTSPGEWRARAATSHTASPAVPACPPVAGALTHRGDARPAHSA